METKAVAILAGFIILSCVWFYFLGRGIGLKEGKCQWADITYRVADPETKELAYANYKQFCGGEDAGE